MAKQYATDLGVALQLTNILRDVPEDLARGRIYIPQEDLRAFGCSEQDLRRETESSGGIHSAAVKALLRHQASARARLLRTRGTGPASRGCAQPRRRRDHGGDLSGNSRQDRDARLRRLLRRRAHPQAPPCAGRSVDVGTNVLLTMSQPSSTDVVVVGAGFAGLSAASALAAAGPARDGPRGAPPARRPGHRIQRSRERRAGRQRPARVVRLLSGDVCVPSADWCRRERPSSVVADRSLRRCGRPSV